MSPNSKIANFKPTYAALNNVQSRAGIGQREGAARFELTVAGPAASVTTAPNETGDLL